ncbi:MAG: hypothetical protein J4G04_08365 [Nitrosopumilaceae archaeon]|nr:hypothetical protein [Nitrosopumilaceae archaeon]
MEAVKRVTYYVGIGISVTLFGLWLAMVVPGMVGNLHLDNATEEEYLALFRGHAAYVAMYERFPNAVEEFIYHDNGREGEMRVGVRNHDSGTELVLSLSSYGAESVHAGVGCESKNRQVEWVTGLFAADFIKRTDCLQRQAVD